jgi:hypothetical protein
VEQVGDEADEPETPGQNDEFILFAELLEELLLVDLGSRVS